MDIEIIQAHVDDAREILTLQQAAHKEDAHVYDDWNVRPITQTLSELHEEFDKCVFAKAMFDGRIVASVSGKTVADTCMVRRLILHPDFQHEGIRASLMQAIEVLCPSAKRFELFTSTKRTDDIRLYEQLGYAAYHHEDFSPLVRIVFMQKSI
jgi:N-acetylglutamate synthase-like GNAT family acetyltransferase